MSLDAITEQLMGVSQVRKLFSVPLQSSATDLHNLVMAYDAYVRSSGETRQALEAEIENVMDIAAVVSTDFDASYGVLTEVFDVLKDTFGAPETRAMLDEAYMRTPLLIFSYVNQLTQGFTRLTDLKQKFNEGSVGKEEYVSSTFDAMGHVLLDFFGARQAYFSFRKTGLFDKKNTTFNEDGLLRAVVHAIIPNPEDVPGLQPEDYDQFRREVAFDQSLATEPNSAFMDYGYPWVILAIEKQRSVVSFLNSEHFEMLLQYEGSIVPQHFDVLEHITYLDRLTEQGTARMAVYDGAFSYSSQVVIPILVGSNVIGYANLDMFKHMSGDAHLDGQAKETLTRYDSYLIQRATARKDNIVNYMREHLPALRDQIIDNCSDGNADEDMLIANRAYSFMSLPQREAFFKAIGVPDFEVSEQELAHLRSFYNSSRPVSRLQLKVADTFIPIFSSAIADFALFDRIEEHGFNTALRTVDTERQIVSSGMLHEGTAPLNNARSGNEHIGNFLTDLPQLQRNQVGASINQFGNQFLDLVRQANPDLVPQFQAAYVAFAQDLVSRLQNTPGLEESRADITSQLVSLSSLQELFSRFQLTSQEKRYHPVHEIIDEVLTRFSKEIKANDITIDAHYCDPNLQVYCQRASLFTAIQMYVKNSVEALLNDEKTGRVLTIATEVKGQDFYFTITDNGESFRPGIDPMAVYDLNFSTKGEGHFGLGLPFARTVIEAKTLHRGHVYTPLINGENKTFSWSIPVNESYAIQDMRREMKTITEN